MDGNLLPQGIFDSSIEGMEDAALTARANLLQPTDNDIGRQLRNVAIAFIVFESFFTILRCLARIIRKIRFSWDDYLMLPSLLAGVCLCILSLSKTTSIQIYR